MSDLTPAFTGVAADGRNRPARQPAQVSLPLLGLATKRYDEFDAGRRLNAIDKQRRSQVQELSKACA